MVNLQLICQHIFATLLYAILKKSEAYGKKKESKIIYISLLRKIDNRIKQDKKCFYQKEIEEAPGDQRATWKGLECSSAPFQRGNIFG